MFLPFLFMWHNKCFLWWLICLHFEDINGRTGAMDYFYNKKLGSFSWKTIWCIFIPMCYTIVLSLWFCYALKLICRQGKASLKFDYFTAGPGFMTKWLFLHFIKISKQSQVFGLIKWSNQLIVSNNRKLVVYKQMQNDYKFFSSLYHISNIGKFGLKNRWYFPFTVSYWKNLCGTERSKRYYLNSNMFFFNENFQEKGL